MTTVLLLDVDRLDEGLTARAASPGTLALAGQPLYQHAARAFAACGDIDRIVLISPAPPATTPALGPVTASLPLDGPPAELVTRLLADYADADHWLLFAANAPLITPPVIERFLSAAPLEAALSVAGVRAARVSAHFGDGVAVPRQAFAGETLAFAPIAIVRPDAVARSQESLAQILAAHGHATELVRRLGVGFSIKLRAGRATLSELSHRLAEVFGGPCVFQILADPEPCLRVTDRATCRVAQARLEGR